MIESNRRRQVLEITLEKIGEIVGGTVIGDKRVVITGINSLDAASPSEISFFTDRRYEDRLHKTKAGAILISRETRSFEGPQVVVSNPKFAYPKVAAFFALPVPKHPGISDRAAVHKTSQIGKDVSIYPMVNVCEGAEIGDGTTLFPGVFIGERVKVGKRCLIYPGVTILRDCLIGDDVIIHSGTVVGGDGFGFVRDGALSVKIPHIGIVQIDDEVEIGANNCIDRAALGKTWLQKGIKTDNLVHIAHNVVVGENSIIVAQAGISGSCHIGSEVIIGGQVGIIDHVDIGDRAMIGPQSGIAKSIPPGEAVSGSPAIPHRLWLKTSALTARLPDINRRLRDLEKRMEELEKHRDRHTQPDQLGGADGSKKD